MGMTNHHRTWSFKALLVGVTRKNSYERGDVECNENGAIRDKKCIYLTYTKYVYSTNSWTSEMQRKLTVPEFVRNCSHVGHSTADTEGLSDTFKQVRGADDLNLCLRSSIITINVSYRNDLR
ncbi:hypothetical protein TNCV_866851 [Trichonephila clavipes]|nr:hypothetical protein TNCV_866851 [Trichonephila clavipes]